MQLTATPVNEIKKNFSQIIMNWHQKTGSLTLGSWYLQSVWKWWRRAVERTSPAQLKIGRPSMWCKWQPVRSNTCTNRLVLEHLEWNRPTRVECSCSPRCCMRCIVDFLPFNFNLDFINRFFWKRKWIFCFHLKFTYHFCVFSAFFVLVLLLFQLESEDKWCGCVDDSF